MSQNSSPLPLAVVTGVCSDIGLELARCCARHGFELLIAAEERAVYGVERTLHSEGAKVSALRTDLATPQGVEKLYAEIAGRPVDALLVTATWGVCDGFLDQDFVEARHVIATNIIGTLDLIQRVGRDMRSRARGRILIAGFAPGRFQTFGNANKAFLNCFSLALRHELKDSGVTVICLMPHPTDVLPFDSAHMPDTKVDDDQVKVHPAEVAQIGFDAMMKGEGDAIAGWNNKLQAAIAYITPSPIQAEQHPKIVESDSARGGIG